MRWTIKPKPEQDAIRDLMDAIKVDPLVATLLLQRGIETYEDALRFFRPQLSHLHDPFLMKDMDLAVRRIEEAIQLGQNILVYGDYDVDGTTAVALVSSYLLERYPNVATYIPDRYAEGYGVSFAGIDFAHDNEIKLIIALDCGIKALDKVAYAREKGIDFIICDHHRPGDQIPQAVAVLDPKRSDCSYPYDELCGCGIGFKLIQALEERAGRPVEGILSYLDLVATAIAADIVPITGENRVLTYYGLEVINQKKRPGIRAILNTVRKSELNVTDVVFIIAPRINAAGRMEHGRYAVALLTETDQARAEEMAKAIEQFNADRRDLDKEITEEALLQIQENKEEDRFTSVVFKESWHKGVIGIVASRLTETYYRPTLVFTRSGEKLAASARSVKGFDLYNALEACKDYLEQFGGHKYAAGLTLEEHQYAAFKARFEEVVSSTIAPEMLRPEIRIDAEINLADITPKLMRILKQFEPFGPGNMKPVFLTHQLRDSGFAKGVGDDEKHLKLAVQQGRSNPLQAIGFGLGEKLPLVKDGGRFSAVYSLEENHWNGQVSLQLKIRDIRPD
ncbi:single-stranded-DNA-specific exonuclease RecJ [Muriicola jejuensis]|uniref:Single-stranded-DNA-specific exonuclease RecJ n=1 Tax=Muriicola jejuensis TaxID=504488 RepID=A0A6P0UBV5_9FLAO|nr:single-stranded-DNA-specific exonuclease RecJ [Muriicola jejuensis]NER10092.1 single-stranded-DNA-specific exonuclease RecJ [Muriicola jejuensis]